MHDVKLNECKTIKVYRILHKWEEFVNRHLFEDRPSVKKKL